MEYKLEDLEEKYELELGRIVETIQRLGVRSEKSEGDGDVSVLLQLPDGLKPYALVIVDYIEQEIRNKKLGIRGKGFGEVSVMIWLGDCFGACDLPDSGCDLVVQFGHAEW